MAGPVADYTAGLVAAPGLWGLCNAGQCRHIPERYRWKYCKTGIYACNNQHEDYVPVEVGMLAAEVVDTRAALPDAVEVVDTRVELPDAVEVVDTRAALPDAAEAADTRVELPDAVEVVDTRAALPDAVEAADKRAAQ